MTTFTNTTAGDRRRATADSCRGRAFLSHPAPLVAAAARVGAIALPGAPGLRLGPGCPPPGRPHPFDPVIYRDATQSNAVSTA